MIAYFDNLQNDCYHRYHIQNLYLDHWQKLGSNLTLLGLAIGIVAIAALYWVWSIISDWIHPLVLVLVLFFGSIILYLIMSAIEHSSGSGGGSGDDVGPKTGAGFVKRFHISMADLVGLIRHALSDKQVPNDLFDIVLTEREGRPRGAVFEMQRSGVRISLWKERDDPYHTLVHLGPITWRNKQDVKTLMGILDELGTRAHM